MKKNLLTIGILALSLSVQAQNVLLHVDDAAKMYVSEGTLVYNGGGLQTRGAGMIDLHGNMMIEGSESNNDVVRTINTGSTPKLDGSNIVVRLNDPNNPATSTYGQLYINGLTQGKITAVVSKEFKAARHGAVGGSYFQQIALPFAGKAISSLSTEFAKTFGTQRFTQNEVLKYNNTLVVSDHYTNLSTATTDPTGYYMLGSKNGNLDVAQPPASMPRIGFGSAENGRVYTINGVPYSSILSSTEPIISRSLSGAGTGINFGVGGNATNQYLEKYNTYLQDNLETTAGTGAWSTNYGKNMYQYGNPFLTNLDLSKIGYAESGAVNDGNNITNIWGVRYDPGTIVTRSNGSTFSKDSKVITITPGSAVPVGDIGLLIKPMQAFVIKLRDNSPQTLNFNNLRRFKNTLRADGTSYNVTAAKNGSSASTVKQLGVIALDAAGNEVGRTYYVVSGNSITGHQDDSNTTVQAASTGGNIIVTFEEALTGGIDQNYSSKYFLYINEANEANFLGKNVKLGNYDYNSTNTAVSYKFEIRENAELIPAGANVLSSGIGFYYKAYNGALQQITQDSVVPITSATADLFYGAPSLGALGTEEGTRPSRTMVVYNPAITDYIVRFDPNWRKADIQVYDMSGKLVISQKAVDTKTDFVIKLDGSVKNSYVVRIVADNGEVVNTKILK